MLKIKKILGISLVLLFLLSVTAVSVSARPSTTSGITKSHYSVVKAAGSNHIQVFYTQSDAKYLGGNDGATAAAADVIKVSKWYDMQRNRSKESIRNEIMVHAIAYRLHFMRSNANPVDIVMSEGEWTWLEAVKRVLSPNQLMKVLNIADI